MTHLKQQRETQWFPHFAEKSLMLFKNIEIPKQLLFM